MRPLQITLMIVAAATFLLQTVRHVHLMLYGEEQQATARYSPGYENKERVQSEKSFAVLLDEYAVAQKAIADLEKGKDQEARQRLHDEQSDLYQRRNALEVEIDARERRGREIRDIWIFSGAGLVLIAIGGAAYLRGAQWSGMTLVIPGFLELLWWSSPSFGMGGALQEYQLLLWNKIALSVIGLGLLYLGWRLVEKRRSVVPQ